MENKQFIKPLLLFFLTGLFLVSCTDKELELEVNSDVVVISKKIGDVVKRAPAFYTYANQSLRSATVTVPGGSVKELETFEGSVYSMSKEPIISDFSDVPPAEGKYVFSVTSQSGATITNEDILDFTGIAVPQITKAEFSGTPKVLNVEWTTVTGADGYFIKMLDTNGKITFNGYIVIATVNKYLVSSASNSGMWIQSPVDKQTYTLQVNAVNFDNDNATGDDIYNISELAIGEMQVVWAEN